MLVGRSTWIAALATGIIALVAPVALAAPPPLDVSVLPADPAPNPPQPCVPAARTLCVPLAPTAEVGGKKLAKATSQARVRRGLGLPAAKKLLGRRGRKRLAESDRRLAQNLAKPLRDPTQAQASAVAKIRRGLTTSDAAKNGTSRQSRRAKIELEVDACPDPLRAEDINGHFAVKGRAEYRVMNVYRHRGGWILDTLELAVTISGPGLVNRNAEYAGILPPVERDKLRVSRSRQTYDPRTGDSDPRFSGHVFFEVLGWDPSGIRYDDLADFTREQGAMDVIGPELTAPNPLRKAAYLKVARQFMSWVDHELHTVVEEAERNWQTPNRCVRLDMEGPARLSPDETTGEIIGRLTPVGGVGAKEGLYGRYMTFGADYIHTGSVTGIATLPLDTEEKWFRYTAPSTPWEDDARPGLDVTAYTKGGIGRAPVTFELADQPLAFKVLSATYTENLAANADIPGSACNLSEVPTSVQQVNSMSLGEQPIDPSNRLTRDPDGSLHGQIAASGMGTASGTLHGCDITVEPPWPACTTPFGGELGGSATAFIVIEPRAATATLSWPMPPLHPNVINPTEVGCLATGFGGDDPNPLPTQASPVDLFYRTNPQTLEFTKSRSVAGGGRSIYSTVSYKIVFRRLTNDELAALDGGG